MSTQIDQQIRATIVSPPAQGLDYRNKAIYSGEGENHSAIEAVSVDWGKKPHARAKFNEKPGSFRGRLPGGRPKGERHVHI